MPKTIEITVYQFNELPEKAKEKARINYLNNWMSDDWWSQCTIDYMKEEGAKRGFRIDDVRFSGFWSQGDGASWCGAVDLPEWIERTFNTTDKEHPLTQIFIALLDEGWIERKVMVEYSNSRYCHENTMDVSCITWHEPREDDVMLMGMFKGANVQELLNMLTIDDGVLDSMHDRLTQDCKDFAREIYKQLQEDYESETSDESIASNYDANEVYFDETGRIA